MFARIAVQIKLNWLKRLYISGVAAESILPLDPDAPEPSSMEHFDTEADQVCVCVCDMHKDMRVLIPRCAACATAGCICVSIWTCSVAQVES